MKIEDFSETENMSSVNNEYDKIAPVYEQVLGSIYDHFKPQINDFFSSLPPHSKLLDAGCGPGIEAEIAHKVFEHNLTGLDANEIMLRRFKKRLPTSQVVHSNITNITTEKNIFDAIFCSCILLHLKREDGIKALKGLNRVLKSGGQIFLVNSISTGEVDWHSREGLTNIGVEKLFFYHWEKEDFLSNIKFAGFKIMDVSVPEPPIPGRPALMIVKAFKE